MIRSGTYTMPEFLERRYDGRARWLFALADAVPHDIRRLGGGALQRFTGLPDFISGGSAMAHRVRVGRRRRLVRHRGRTARRHLHRGGTGCGTDCRCACHQRRCLPPGRRVACGDDGSGLLLGVPLLGFYYWCANQTIVQRLLSARDIDHARWGALFAGLLKLPVLFLMVLPGTCALILFPHLPRADMVYPRLILDLLPAGLVGLVVAGFIAATMVSIASLLNSASTLVTMDLVRRLEPNLSNSGTVRAGRITTGILLIVAVAWAPQLQHFPSLWQYLQAVLAYAVPPVVAVLGIGMFWRRANADGAAATLVLGSLCGLGMFLVNAVFHRTHLHFLYAAPILTSIDAAILVCVSLSTPAAASARSDATMWGLNYTHTEQVRLRKVPLWQDYRFLAAVLLTLTAAVVIAFR